MKINITGRHFDLSDSIKEYVEDKIGRHEKIFSGLTEVDVLLKGEDRTCHCELILHLKNKQNAVIDVANDSMYAAIDLASDKAQRQLRKFKGKMSERRHRKAGVMQENDADTED
ncbi:MAG: ribosome hibernation-promoting factor, HPF/YfiA family [Planctomycetota bacterium]|jgi:putative sigma-54 modulation protein